MRTAREGGVMPIVKDAIALYILAYKSKHFRTRKSARNRLNSLIGLMKADAYRQFIEQIDSEKQAYSRHD